MSKLCSVGYFRVVLLQSLCGAHKIMGYNGNWIFVGDENRMSLIGDLTMLVLSHKSANGVSGFLLCLEGMFEQ